VRVIDKLFISHVHASAEWLVRVLLIPVIHAGSAAMVPDFGAASLSADVDKVSVHALLDRA